MRFLGDENCQLGSLRVLRDAGHDTVAITRDSPGITDRQVLELAVREDRIVLTFDKDFYRRVYEDQLPAPPGIDQFSLRQPQRREAGERLLSLLACGLQLDGFVTLITRQAADQSPLP